MGHLCLKPLNRMDYYIHIIIHSLYIFVINKIVLLPHKCTFSEIDYKPVLHL